MCRRECRGSSCPDWEPYLELEGMGKKANESSPCLWLMPGYSEPYQSGHMEDVGTGRSRAETFQTGVL